MVDDACQRACESLGPWGPIMITAVSLAWGIWQRHRAARLGREVVVLRESLRPRPYRGDT